MIAWRFATGVTAALPDPGPQIHYRCGPPLPIAPGYRFGPDPCAERVAEISLGAAVHTTLRTGIRSP